MEYFAIEIIKLALYIYIQRNGTGLYKAGHTSQKLIKKRN